MTASSRRKFIICLDTILLIVFLLLLAPRLTGLPLHEWLGFIFLIILILHLLLAWTWIQNATKNFFRTANKRTKVNFFLNAALFLLSVSELFSGFLISQVLLPDFGIKTINDSSWRALHNIPLNFIVLFAGLHIAINWSWIVAVFKKRQTKQDSNVKSPAIATILFRIAILIFSAAVIALILFSILGRPSFDRLLNQDEIARFSPSFRHGAIQLFGEALLVAFYAFLARKLLRVRL